MLPMMRRRAFSPQLTCRGMERSYLRYRQRNKKKKKRDKMLLRLKEKDIELSEMYTHGPRRLRDINQHREQMRRLLSELRDIETEIDEVWATFKMRRAHVGRTTTCVRENKKSNPCKLGFFFPFHLHIMFPYWICLLKETDREMSRQSRRPDTSQGSTADSGECPQSNRIPSLKKKFHTVLKDSSSTVATPSMALPQVQHKKDGELCDEVPSKKVPKSEVLDSCSERENEISEANYLGDMVNSAIQEDDMKNVVNVRDKIIENDDGTFQRHVTHTAPPLVKKCSAVSEEPHTNVKNLSINVVPAPSSEVERLPIAESCLKAKEKSEMPPWSCEEKRERALLRDSTWLPLDELPCPKLDKMQLNYIDRFEPLSCIISQISEGKSPRPQVTMRYELLRICTLRTYPKDNKPFMIKYAKAGFYYASDGDGVVCYCCGIRRYGWVEADDPMEVHKRINPRCKFIINNGEHNVPAMAEGPLRQNVARLDMIPDCDPVRSPGEDVNNSQRARLGVQMAIPKHAHMAIKTVREQSFNGNWPNTPKYSPAELADGGFFFTGIGDCVRCFFCGIGLRHWDKEDDMWVEHARWSQHCTFLIQKKRQNFVDLVQLAVEHLDDSDQSSNNLYKNLVSEAAQKVLDASDYTPQQIKNAIVAILTIETNTMVNGWKLKQKVEELVNEQSATNKKPADESGNATEPPVRNFVSESELSNNPEHIQQENEQLKEQTLCKVCLDNIVSIVFLPCGHLVTCADCAPALRKCPICRADVKGTVRTRMN